jgi:subtilase family serine protease
VGPISVNLLASTPFTVAVGGTQFNENGQASTYWKTVNGPDGLSVKSYIPENVWNQSCTSAQCNANANILAGGGGASTIFSKPSWQSGVAGIPTDGARDLPDISLSAAGHDPYVLCYEGSCQTGFVATVFGTSASAPSFAGIMALVNQKTGSRQGQANYVLYRLAAAESRRPRTRLRRQMGTICFGRTASGARRSFFGQR